MGSWYARMLDRDEAAAFELVPTGRWGRVTVSNPGWPVVDWSRTPVYTTEFGSELVPVDPADAAETWSRGWSVGYSWVDEVAEFTGLMPVASARERMGLPPVEEDAGDEVTVPTVQERALEARRTRNTGPAARRRAPRRIDSPRSR